MGEQSGSEYVIVHPEKMSCRHLAKELAHPHRNTVEFGKFAEWTSEGGGLSENWRTVLSLLLIRLLHLLYKPMKYFGILIEFILNFLHLNGGPIAATLRLLTGRLEVPKRDSEKFLSIIGLLERRIDLWKLAKDIVDSGKAEHPPADPGDRFYIDLCAMACSLAYENQRVIKERVTTHWKMHFVKFYSLWNDKQKSYGTQAYIFTDREDDANLIGLVFRGTEPFNAKDWATDADMSWFKIPFVGKVHLGFMEGLGVANRLEEGNVLRNLDNPTEVTDKPLAYYTLVSELQRLLETHKNARVVVTGHSLGGALTILFAAILILKNEAEILRRLTGVYTYGQPRVGDEAFGNFVDKKLNTPIPRYYRIVYCNDIVPRVPFDDSISLFKHFGTCLYYHSFYQLKNLKEEPNKNFSVLYFLLNRLNALWEACACFFLHYIEGPDFRETWLCCISRFTMGLLFPGMVSHFLVNYVHSARLGPPYVKLTSTY